MEKGEGRSGTPESFLIGQIGFRSDAKWTNQIPSLLGEPGSQFNQNQTRLDKKQTLHLNTFFSFSSEFQNCKNGNHVNALVTSTQSQINPLFIVRVEITYASENWSSNPWSTSLCVFVRVCVGPKSLSGCVSVRCASVPGDGVGGLQDLLGRAAGARRVPGLGGPLHGRLGQRRRHRQVLQPIRGARRPHQECRFSPGGSRWWSDWLPRGMLLECEILGYWCTLEMRCAVFRQSHWLIISTWTWFSFFFLPTWQKFYFLCSVLSLILFSLPTPEGLDGCSHEQVSLTSSPRVLVVFVSLLL